jgi:MFS family permease
MANRSPGAVVVAGYALVGLSWLVFGVHPAIATAIAMVVIISIGEMLYKPTATAAVADAAPPGYEGRYQSLYAAASISGTVLAPSIGGALFQHHPGVLWLGAAVLPLAAAVVLLRASRQAGRIDAHDSLAVARELSGRPQSPATPEPR